MKIHPSLLVATFVTICTLTITLQSNAQTIGDTVYTCHEKTYWNAPTDFFACQGIVTQVLGSKYRVEFTHQCDRGGKYQGLSQILNGNQLFYESEVTWRSNLFGQQPFCNPSLFK